jgi:hypothetical protein
MMKKGQPEPLTLLPPSIMVPGHSSISRRNKQSMEANSIQQSPELHAAKKPTPRLCKQHRSVNPGQCPACVLAEYYERQIALLGEKITMLQGTIDTFLPLEE